MIKIESSRTQPVGINLTPMVDVVFLLLIFFLLTAFFIQPEGVDVNLPEADSPAVQENKELVVVVETGGRIMLADHEVSLDELEAEVGRELATNSARPVVIRADRELVLQQAIAVMERCKKAGAARLIIATEAPGADE